MSNLFYTRDMEISSNLFLYIDVAIMAIYVLFVLIGYKNGLMLQVVDLLFNILAIFFAYFISPILAAHFPIVKMDEVYTALKINVLIDVFIYCVIVYVLLRILYMFIKPLFKSVSKIPLIGFLNKLGGFLFGIVNATILMLVISLLLTTPLISNGNEVRDNTLFKYCNELSGKAVTFSLKYINFEALKDSIDDFDVDKARSDFNNWLVDKGVIND